MQTFISNAYYLLTAPSGQKQIVQYKSSNWGHCFKVARSQDQYFFGENRIKEFDLKPLIIYVHEPHM